MGGLELLEEYFVLILHGYVQGELYYKKDLEIFESPTYPEIDVIKHWVDKLESQYEKVEKRYR